MNGPAVVIAACLLGLGFLLHHYDRLPRFTPWIFAAAAAAGTVGFPVFLDALAGLTATKKGLAVFGVGSLVLLVVLTLETVPAPGAMSGRLRNINRRAKGEKARPVQVTRRERKHEGVIKPVIGVLFGSSVILILGSRDRLLTGAGQSAAQTTSLAGSTITQIQTGKAAHVVPPGSQMSIAVTGLVVIAAFIVFLVSHQRRRLRTRGLLPPKGSKGNRGNTGFGGGDASGLPGGGRPPSGLPSGRRA